MPELSLHTELSESISRYSGRSSDKRGQYSQRYSESFDRSNWSNPPRGCYVAATVSPMATPAFEHHINIVRLARLGRRCQCLLRPVAGAVVLGPQLFGRHRTGTCTDIPGALLTYNTSTAVFSDKTSTPPACYNSERARNIKSLS